ncbi:hypothetical protein AK812_SmicGene8886 [Symbiodinium microadriaticum]|uniref:Uncharacterized protein n=1 Tax=Symbiodinium microadriaticum TaxID=2951 RepID=A0A1Q9EJV1_SYMMI|nr:hypothetical protein AK812_SmicGene8886 [Symbiodinium microadriaticum]
MLTELQVLRAHLVGPLLILLKAALVHCMAPFDVDLCMLNLSTCYVVMGGTTCDLGCNSPSYAGVATTAFCPDGNTDPFEPLNWSMPVCLPNCDARTPVSCADTHYGNPSAACVVNDDCVAEWRCEENNVDPTKVTSPEPEIVPPGYIRAVDNWRCAPGYVGAPKAPYAGTPGVAACPADNIDPFAPVSLAVKSSFLRL